MSKMEKRLTEYRELRDASRAVLMADVDHARETYSTKGLTNRYFGRVTEGAKDVYEVAKVNTVDNRGILALLVGALAIWFGREPILAALDLEEVGEESEPNTAISDPVDQNPTEVADTPEDTPLGDDDEH